MRYRKLDANDDYTIGTSNDFFLNNAEAVRQAILTRLRLWRGEWFLDISEGTPWQTQVLGKLQRGKNPDAAVKQRVLGTAGVKEILSYTSTFNGTTRQVKIDATVGTIYGDVIINEVI